MRVWLERLWMADLLVVMVCFGWLVVAATGEATGHTWGWQLWLRLWQPLIQPALGLLMAGAIASGTWSWWQQKRR
ncbi:MAG TPA: hypothetical protein DCQ32_01860 [Cyanobacteria bacterium UBA8156]|jgi:hypothetical protein|nr:hypothetical protein [Cyanobacteria bacterium UBA8156]